MALPGYTRSIAQMQSNGSALSGSTAETSLLHSTGKRTVPGETLKYKGQHWRLRASGSISTVVTTPGTMIMKLKAGSTAVATSQAWALNVVSKTNVPWWLDLMITLRATGSSAQLLTNGYWLSEAVVGSPLPSAGGNGALPWQAAASTLGTAFDATISNIFDLTGTWSVNSGSNSITCEQFQIEEVD